MPSYSNQLAKISIPRHRRADDTSKLTTTEHTQYRGILGMLAWLATQTGPDLCFSVSKAQGAAASPTIGDLKEANNLVDQAQAHSEFFLTIPSIDPFSACLCCVSDASFANMPGGKSQSGTLVLLGDSEVGQGRTGAIAPLDWRSGRQKRAVRSTYGAETLALSDSVDRGDYLRGLWHDILFGVDPRLSEVDGLPMRWITDCRDLYDHLSRDGVASTAEARLALEICILKELLQRPHHELRWIGTDQMLSDCLTKSSIEGAYLRERLQAGTWCYTDTPELARQRKASAKAKTKAASQ